MPSFTKPGASLDFYRMFNARSETVAEKSVFSRLLSCQRCVVLLEGFFEWKAEGAFCVSACVVARRVLTVCVSEHAESFGALFICDALWQRRGTCIAAAISCRAYLGRSRGSETP